MRFAGVRQLFHLQKAPSTQTLARSLAETGSPSGTLVWADRQTAGRGRMDRRWSSAEGGVYATLLLRPRIAPRKLGEFGLLAAGSVAKALCGYSLDCTVRPPNDVLARGRKIGGLLAEAASRRGRTEWILLGIGVNVNNPLPAELRAASLLSLTGIRHEPEEVLGRILERFQADFRAWRRAGDGRRRV